MILGPGHRWEKFMVAPVLSRKAASPSRGPSSTFLFAAPRPEHRAESFFRQPKAMIVFVNSIRSSGSRDPPQ